MNTMQRRSRYGVALATVALGACAPDGGAAIAQGHELTPAVSAACALRAGRAAEHEGLDDFFFPQGGDADGTLSSYVNPCSGNLLLQGNVAGHSLLILSYNSAEAARDDVVGHGWRLYANTSLAEDADGTVMITWGDGGVTAFSPSSDGYRSPRGLHGELTEADGVFTLRMQGNVRYVFEGGWLTRSIDRNDNETLIERPATDPGRPTRLVDGDGRVWTLAWAGGRLASITDPVARVISFAHTDGDLVAIRFPDVAGGSPIERLTYAGATHLPIEERSPGGMTRAFAFTSDGRVQTVSDWTGAVVRADWFPTQTVIRNGFGEVHTLCFDTDGAWGKLASWKDSLGAVERYQRDADGYLVGWVDRHGDTWSYTWDSGGNQTSELDPAGHVKSYAWDARGNLLWRSEAGTSTAYTYDANDQLTSISGPVPGDLTTVEVDAHGNALSIRDTTGIERAAMSYDARGRMLTLAAYGRSWAWTYDAFGGIASHADPFSGTTTYTRNAIGQVLAQVDPRGHEFTFAYDAWGRELGVAGSSASLDRVLDRDGRLVSVTVGDGTLVNDTFAYDDAGRLRSAAHNAVPVLVDSIFDTPSAPPATTAALVCE